MVEGVGMAGGAIIDGEPMGVSHFLSNSFLAASLAASFFGVQAAQPSQMQIWSTWLRRQSLVSSQVLKSTWRVMALPDRLTQEMEQSAKDRLRRSSYQGLGLQVLNNTH